MFIRVCSKRWSLAALSSVPGAAEPWCASQQTQTRQSHRFWPSCVDGVLNPIFLSAESPLMLLPSNSRKSPKCLQDTVSTPTCVELVQSASRRLMKKRQRRRHITCPRSPVGGGGSKTRTRQRPAGSASGAPACLLAFRRTPRLVCLFFLVIGVLHESCRSSVFDGPCQREGDGATCEDRQPTRTGTPASSTARAGTSCEMIRKKTRSTSSSPLATHRCL